MDVLLLPVPSSTAGLKSFIRCFAQPSWISVMEHAQRRTPGIVCGRTLSTEPGLAVGLYHDVSGTLNGESA